MTSETKKALDSISDQMAMAMLHAVLVPVGFVALMWVAIAWLTPQLNAVLEPAQLSGIAYGVYITADFMANNTFTCFSMLAGAGFLVGRFLAPKQR